MVTVNNTGEPSRPIAASGVTPRFISCCQEELVELELEALRLGRDQALADGTAPLHNMAAVAKAAVCACDHALAEHYIALDEARFRDVFTLAWCAGYRSQAQGAQAVAGTQSH